MIEKKTGRPKKPEELKSIPIGISMTRAQAQKFKRLGGTRFLRKLIDAVKETP